jgi:drug/metabolite transporter superfamily protein YnfA
MFEEEGACAILGWRRCIKEVVAGGQVPFVQVVILGVVSHRQESIYIRRNMARYLETIGAFVASSLMHHLFIDIVTSTRWG